MDLCLKKDGELLVLSKWQWKLAIHHAAGDLVFAAGGAYRQRSEVHFMDNLLLAPRGKLPALFSH